eukprot:CAMPEP_0168763228 /NCGR_PEP_ID=MMETSP0724-20121128/24250_1 /TAXON_ID=265536 /ORGANISM="Amphiprora sp., Strain CCMP467" /LENGTH=73 /DNA_ID=CAMNT_0008812415 /DNA_START=25 /DNA_END=246 /DNA_ORIENTATION=-
MRRGGPGGNLPSTCPIVQQSLLTIRACVALEMYLPQVLKDTEPGDGQDTDDDLYHLAAEVLQYFSMVCNRESC